MHILHKIVLTMGFGIVATAGIGADFVIQKQKAAEPSYDRASYIAGLFDRFGNEGGLTGLIFRGSAVIDLAMPDPPAGWEPWFIDNGHFGAVFSDEQWLVQQREYAKVEAQVPEIADLSETDYELWNAYSGDTATAYERGQNIILMYVSDDNNQINHPVLQRLFKLGDAHFEALATRKDWQSFNGQLWQEIEDPVTQAENGLRAHELRMFDTTFGSITIQLETRASDQAIVQFLEDFDLESLRRLGGVDATSGPA